MTIRFVFSLIQLVKESYFGSETIEYHRASKAKFYIEPIPNNFT